MTRRTVATVAGIGAGLADAFRRLETGLQGRGAAGRARIRPARADATAGVYAAFPAMVANPARRSMVANPAARRSMVADACPLPANGRTVEPLTGRTLPARHMVATACPPESSEAGRGQRLRRSMVAAFDVAGIIGSGRHTVATACPRDIPESIPRTVARRIKSGRGTVERLRRVRWWRTDRRRTVATVERSPLPARSIFAADGLRVPAACDILSRVARSSGS